METHLRLGIDLDGVLSSFNEAFIPFVKERTGVELPPLSENYPDTWNYHTDAGVTPAQDAELWKAISESFNFWLRLKPLPESVELLKKLAVLETQHDYYFITSRPGATAKFQSEAWLVKWFTLPTVLIAKAKGPIAKSLKLDLFIDDKPENCNEVVDATDGKCIVLMPERPYNRNIIVDHRVQRVKNLEKVLGQILWPNGVPIGKLPLEGRAA